MHLNVAASCDARIISPVVRYLNGEIGISRNNNVEPVT